MKHWMTSVGHASRTSNACALASTKLALGCFRYRYLHHPQYLAGCSSKISTGGCACGCTTDWSGSASHISSGRLALVFRPLTLTGYEGALKPNPVSFLWPQKACAYLSWVHFNLAMTSGSFIYVLGLSDCMISNQKCKIMVSTYPSYSYLF